MPIKGIIVMILLMVIADTVYAIYKAKKLKESVTSDKLFNIVPKFGTYLFFIVMAFLVDTFIFDGTLPVIGLTNGLSKIVGGICFIIELKSIDETSVKLGNRSFDLIIKDFINVIRKYKKNLNDLKDE